MIGEQNMTDVERLFWEIAGIDVTVEQIEYTSEELALFSEFLLHLKEGGNLEKQSKRKTKNKVGSAYFNALEALLTHIYGIEGLLAIMGYLTEDPAFIKLYPDVKTDSDLYKYIQKTKSFDSLPFRLSSWMDDEEDEDNEDDLF